MADETCLNQQNSEAPESFLASSATATCCHTAPGTVALQARDGWQCGCRLAVWQFGAALPSPHYRVGGGGAEGVTLGGVFFSPHLNRGPVQLDQACTGLGTCHLVCGQQLGVIPGGIVKTLGLGQFLTGLTDYTACLVTGSLPPLLSRRRVDHPSLGSLTEREEPYLNHRSPSAEPCRQALTLACPLQKWWWACTCV